MSSAGSSGPVLTVSKRSEARSTTSQKSSAITVESSGRSSAATFPRPSALVMSAFAPEWPSL